MKMILMRRDLDNNSSKSKKVVKEGQKIPTEMTSSWKTEKGKGRKSGVCVERQNPSDTCTDRGHLKKIRPFVKITLACI